MLCQERSAVSAGTPSRDASAKQEQSSGKGQLLVENDNVDREGIEDQPDIPFRCAVAGEVPDNFAKVHNRQCRCGENGTNLFTTRFAEQQGQKGRSVKNRQGHSRAASRRRSARKASREASGLSPSSRRVSVWARPTT